MTYLYSPPTWRNPVLMGGALTPKITTSTVVYRQSGVWHNQLNAYMDNPVVANCDTDPSGLLLFFTGPTPVPNSLYAELSAVTPADPSWSPGTLTLLP
jgi:hypothetical protein